jgi:hypothetical protein
MDLSTSELSLRFFEAANSMLKLGERSGPLSRRQVHQKLCSPGCMMGFSAAHQAGNNHPMEQYVIAAEASRESL